MAPDLRRKVDAARAARLAREAELKKQVEAQVSKIEVRLCLTGPLIAFHFFFFCSTFIPSRHQLESRQKPRNQYGRQSKHLEPFVHLIRICYKRHSIVLYHVYFILGCLTSLAE